MLDPDNLAERVLAPACEEAGVEWAGFHTFRHTVASRLFEQGRNVVQVQRWLGHHSPSFTLDTYVHLLDDGLDAPDLFDEVVAPRGTPGRATRPLRSPLAGSLAEGAGRAAAFVQSSSRLVARPRA